VVGAQHVIRLESYREVAEALRARELRQALYDAGEALMGSVIVNLHGHEHVERRRLENRLFRRDVFAAWERELIAPVVDAALAPWLDVGEVDLLQLARTAMMTVSRRVAGIDLPDDRPDTLAEFAALMNRMAVASIVVHSTLPRDQIIADGNAALAEFERRFYTPSRDRRVSLIGDVEHGRLHETDLPRDVLTVLLWNQDRLALDDHAVLREAAYYPWVGAHSTSIEFVFAMDEILGWLADHPKDLDGACEPGWLLACVHESLRLHPASPEARRRVVEPLTLSSGRHLPAGAELTLAMTTANRDPDVFGDDADVFRPGRSLPVRVAPWGLSFGTGTHACLGQALAGGVPIAEEPDAETHLYGAIVAMASRLFVHGAHPHPTRSPRRDEHTTRPNFAEYWVALRSGGDATTAEPPSPSEPH
jgi:cytochrome P450